MAIHSFNDLVKALTNAVVEARRLSEQQHINGLNRYFHTNTNNEWIANTVKITIPNPSAEGDPYIAIDVPLITLIPVNSLLISDVEVEFEAFLSSVDEDNSKHKTLKMELGGRGLVGEKTNNVKVKVCMKGTDPPEGIIRIHDQFMRYIP